jgi:hypothetical protein
MPADGKWITDALAADYKHIPMWGNIGNIEISGDMEISGTSSISLTRMLARVDVQIAATNFKISSVDVYNYNTKGSLVPVATGTWDNNQQKAIAPNVPAGSSVLTKGPVVYDNKDGRTEINTSTNNCAKEIYIFEAENHTGTGHTVAKDHLDRTCIVVGGIYGNDNEPTYYRADFSTGSDDSEKFLDVLRNHHYTFKITKVAGSGYGTSEDAFLGAKQIDFTVDVTSWGENHEIPLEREVPLQPTANSYIVETKKAIAIPLFGQARQAMDAEHLSNTWIDETMNLKGELIWAEEGADAVVKSYSVNVFKSSQNKYGIPILTVVANNEGNALVGVYNDANGNGVCDAGEGFLWSWHIWVTNYKPVDAGGGFMDRNLGAMSSSRGNAGAIGLHYQFGRKDPFPAAATINDNTQRTVYNSRGEKVDFSAEIDASLPYSINNPVNFSTAWSGSRGNTSWDNGKKTAYDPCPAGWRVPAGKQPFGNQTDKTLIKDGAKQGAFNASIGGWYPYGGIRTTATAITGTGNYGYYHGATTAQGNNGKMYSLELDGTTGKVFPEGDKSRRYQGLSVRCVRDESASLLTTDSEDRVIRTDAGTYNIKVESNTGWEALIKRGTDEVTVVTGDNDNSVLGKPLLNPATGWNGGPSSAPISGLGNAVITVTTVDYSNLSIYVEGSITIVFRDKATGTILNETTIKAVKARQ